MNRRKFIKGGLLGILGISNGLFVQSGQTKKDVLSVCHKLNKDEFDRAFSCDIISKYKVGDIVEMVDDDYVNHILIKKGTKGKVVDMKYTNRSLPWAENWVSYGVIFKGIDFVVGCSESNFK